MAARAANVHEDAAPVARDWRLLTRAGLEVVQEVELEEVDDAGRDLVRAGRRRLDCVRLAVEDHAARRRHGAARARGGQIRIDRAQPHLVVQRSDDEFSDGDRPPVQEERPNAQVGVDALDARGVDRAVGASGDRAVADALALETQGDRLLVALRLLDRRSADVAQVGGDLVGEHFLEAEPEEVGRIPAVRTRHDVPARAGCAARPSVTARAAVHEAGADREIRVDVPGAVARDRPLSLIARELSLEELAPAPDRAERVTIDDEDRACWSGVASASDTGLIDE